jgi:hypothetical protein
MSTHETQKVRLVVNVTEDQLAAYHAAAAADRRRVTEWVRLRLDDAAAAEKATQK